MRKVKVCPFLTSVLMSLVLVLGSFVSLVHASEYPDPTAGNTDPSETERVYECDGYIVTFSLVSLWNSGYNLNVGIENTGSEPILNWHLSFDYAGEITNIWCAEIQETTDDGYIVKNVGYNMDIAPGGSTSFGISENTSFPGFPENVIIPGGNNETVQSDYSVVYTVENDWGDGSVGNICITNNTGSTINDWSLSFDFDREIISVWGGVIESSENGHYVVRHAVDNPDILPGQSVVFGMICSAGSSGEEPENYELTSYNVGDVQIDDPDVDTDGDGLTDGVEESVGTNPELPDTDGDGLSDYQEIYLTWTDPLLTDTDDNGISDANEDLDGDGLGNLDEIVRGTDTGNPDTDRDDLSDYDEIYVYGTDPLNPDSDGDTLSDGDDVLLGFSPILPDTDYNGILDCNELVYQTAENDFPLGDGRGITNVSVSMNISGNIEKEVGILNMYDFDVQSREVVGLIGVPMEIRTDEAFDSATITFTYDENMLGDTPEENLSLMWYDEENQWYQILDRESVVDTVNNTVSYTTTHFSTYLLIDKSTWYDHWNTTYESIYSEDLLGNIQYSNVDTDYVIISDYSFFLSSEQQTLVDQIKESLYVKINMENGLVIANITSRNGEGTYWDGDGFYLQGAIEYYQNHGFGFSYVNDIYSMVSKPYPADMNTILESVMYAVDKYPYLYDSDIISVMLISRGGFNVNESVLHECVDRGIRIYAIDVANESINADFKNLSYITGGKYYYGQIYDDVLAFTDLALSDAKGVINTADQDMDNIPDFYEEHGMICSNGKILYSDPQSAHSDNDGLKDGLEVEMTSDVVRYIGKDKNLTIHYFIEHSDPLKEDTDGDGINDNIDSNPLLGMVSEVNLNNRFGYDYLHIDNMDGGNQLWWFDKLNFNWRGELDRSNYMIYPAYRIGKCGCGLIAVNDLELYLTQQNDGYSLLWHYTALETNLGPIDKNSYMEYAEYNQNVRYNMMYPRSIAIGGLTGYDLVPGLTDYLRENNCPYHNVKWSSSKDSEKIIQTIKQMISRDIPVIFSYDTTFNGLSSLKMYHEKNDDSIEDWYRVITDDFSQSVYQDTITDGHYMTIIGYIQYMDENKTPKYILKIVSWGSIYYIKYEDFAKGLSISQNILEIN